MENSEDFYVRYYVGHKGRFGHEFLEFEFRPDGRCRYANNSNYKNDTMIKKEMFVSGIVMDQLKKIIQESEVMNGDDSKWPEPAKSGRQELEVVMGDDHISFTVSKLHNSIKFCVIFIQRLQKLDLWLKLITVMILMDFVLFTISFKT